MHIPICSLVVNVTVIIQSLKMATAPDDNSGITKLDESPVPKEIINSIFLRGALMCHIYLYIITPACNLNNYPRNRCRCYDSTKHGALEKGGNLQHGLKRFTTIKAISKKVTSMLC